MDIEKAIKKLKETQDSYLKDELDLAIETALNELDKKDKAIKYIEETFELEEDKNITELYNILK